MRYPFIIILMLFFPNFNKGQEMLGISGSDYAGLNGATLNPATIVSFPVQWEVNLMTLNLFFDNNYGYMKDQNIYKLLKEHRLPHEKWYQFNYDFSDIDENDFYYPLDNLVNKSGYFNFFLSGPSVLVKYKHHSFALRNNLRTIISINKINLTLPTFPDASDNPEDLFLELNNKDFEFEIPKFRINTMGWSEWSLSYGTILKHTPYFSINGGITIKRLRGYAGGYLLNHVLEVGLSGNIADTSINVTGEIDLEFAYINPESYDPYPDYSVKNILNTVRKGKGIGMDIGIEIEQKDIFHRVRYKGGWGVVRDLGEHHKLEDQWRLGISLIDVGRIKFTKNIQKFTIDSVISSNVKDMDVLVNSGDYDLMENIESTGDFKIILPTAIVLQLDYKFVHNLYLHSTWVQRIPKVFMRPGIDRANIFSLTPRFELERFGVSMPFILYQYRYPRVGLAFRIGFFSIGTDKLSSYIIGKKLSGIDIYFSIRIKPQRKKGYEMPCPYSPYQ